MQAQDDRAVLRVGGLSGWRNRMQMGVVGDPDPGADAGQVVQHPAVGGAHVGGGEHAEAAGMAVEEAAGLIAEQPPARPLEERDQEINAIGRGELALDLRAHRVVARAVDEQVRRGERDRGPSWGAGLPYPVQARIDEGEELARRRREGVVAEDRRVLDR